MLSSNQETMIYNTLLGTLQASGVITKDAQPSWPMLITIADEYQEHLKEEAAKPPVEPMDPQQCYQCDSGVMDQLVVYPAEYERGHSRAIAFVCESMTGQRDNKASALLSHDDVRRLRNQLNQLLGE